MEELLPFIFFIFWLLVSGLAGKKKREEAQRGERAQREAREAQARARAAARRGERDAYAADTSPARPTESSGSGGGAMTDTALDMVPDELWAILTGGAPRPGAPTPAPVPAPREPEPYVDEWEPATPEQGGWVTEPPWDEESAVDSIEGVSAENARENTLDYDDLAEQHARGRYENLRVSTWDDRPSRDAAAVRMSETSDIRHFEFHDRLRESEIGAAGEATGVSRIDRIGLGRRAEVRRAIVLAEVLGPPKSLQT